MLLTRDEEEEDPLEERVDLQRLPTSTCGACDGCADDKSKMMLTLTLSKNYLTLCPTCEGELLTKMLANYLRRKARGKKNGFTGELLKEEEKQVRETDGDDPADEDLTFEMEAYYGSRD